MVARDGKNTSLYVKMIQYSNVSARKHGSTACSHVDISGSFRIVMAELSSFDRDCTAHQSLKWFLPGLLRKFYQTLPRWLSGKESAWQAGNVGSFPGKCGFIAWVGKIPRAGNGNPLQYSCLGNPMDRRAWWAIVCGVAESTQLKDQTTTTS